MALLPALIVLTVPIGVAVARAPLRTITERFVAPDHVPTLVSPPDDLFQHIFMAQPVVELFAMLLYPITVVGIVVLALLNAHTMIKSLAVVEDIEHTFVLADVACTRVILAATVASEGASKT